MNSESCVSTADTNTSEEQGSHTVRKYRRVTGEKICQVCSEKALAHHFGALACESCKAFFRRNALKTEEEKAKCAFHGECTIDKHTRRFCSACRLKKCFAIGMQADLILDENGRKELREKVMKNRARLQQSKMLQSQEGGAKSIEQAGTEDLLAVTPRSSLGVDVSSQSLLAGVKSLAVQCDAIEQSKDSAHSEWSSHLDQNCGGLNAVSPVVSYSAQSFSPTTSAPVSSTGVNDARLMEAQGFMSGWAAELSSPVSSSPGELSSSRPHNACATWQTPARHPVPSQSQDSVVSSHQTSVRNMEALMMEFQPFSQEGLPSDPYQYRRLSEEERNLLANLSAAYQDTILGILKGDPPRDFVTDISMEFWLKLAEEEVRDVIGFAKRVEDFKKLSTNEQIELLKTSTIQVLTVRVASLFVLEKNAMVCDMGYLSMEHLKVMFTEDQRQVTETYMQLCYTLKFMVKNDVTVYALLHCLAMFDPGHDLISDRQRISSIRDRYTLLLRHYLESVYTFKRSDRYMNALHYLLHKSKEYVQENLAMMRKYFPFEQNQLMAEVLNLS